MAVSVKSPPEGTVNAQVLRRLLLGVSQEGRHRRRSEVARVPGLPGALCAGPRAQCREGWSG